MIDVEDVLSFWFDGDLNAQRSVWFEQDAGFDGGCKWFGEARNAAKLGELDYWAGTPRGALALIILLDQLSRNLYRDSAEAFAADHEAREVARTAIRRGFDQLVPPVARSFFYLPFEHSEDLADQDESVLLLDPLGEEHARYAHSHREVIRRFGRFPRRNAALGRISSDAEQAHLADPNVDF